MPVAASDAFLAGRQAQPDRRGAVAGPQGIETQHSEADRGHEAATRRQMVFGPLVGSIHVASPNHDSALTWMSTEWKFVRSFTVVYK